MKPAVLLALLLVLPGCSAIAKFQAAAEKLDAVNLRIDQVDKAVESVGDALGDKFPELMGKVQSVRESIVAADADGSGDISGPSEWKNLLLGLLGSLGVTGAAAYKLNASRKERTDELYEENVGLKERLTKLEAKSGG